MEELHLTKKDFKVEWFSGTGPGGQRRNKVQCCCRIRHNQTGLSSQGTRHATRLANQKEAFEKLAKLIIAHYDVPEEKKVNNDVIRNYHGVRNEVLDKASGLRMSYKDVVENSNIDPMIVARKEAISGSDID